MHALREIPPMNPLRHPARHLALSVAWVVVSAVPVLGDAEAFGWIRAESPHTVVFAQTEADQAIEIVRSIDRFRAMFERLSPGLALNSPVPTQIFAFRDAESHGPYKTIPETDGVRVLGQMIAHPDGNYITLDAGAPAEGAYSVVFHEYVHYLVRHNFPAVPRWFNEGLAEYYSTFRIEGERAVLGRPVARHLRWFTRHPVDLTEVLADERGLGRRHDTRQVGDFYAGSWALVHYLLSGDAERLERTGEWLARLAEGESPDSAFERVFGLRIRGLEREVSEYVGRGDFPVASVALDDLDRGVSSARTSALSAAGAYRRLADLAAHLPRLELAERRVDRALELDPQDGDAYGVLATCAMSRVAGTRPSSSTATRSPSAPALL